MNGLEDNLDTFVSALALVIGGGALLVTLVVLAVAVAHDRRQARERAARRAAAKPQPKRPCHVKPCGYAGQTLVRRGDTRQLEPVCLAHLDEGFLRGWWA